jgi:hypothetical protein
MLAIKTILKYLLGTLLLIQLIQVDYKQLKSDKNLEIQAPKEIMSILKRSCYDCHSNTVNLPWYANIAPLSWEISRHVTLGRKWVNFSIWNSYTAEQKDTKLEELYKSVYQVMPLQDYVKFHPEAALTKEDRNLLRAWTGKAPF